MTEPTAPSTTPGTTDPPVELGAALSQMAGLVLSRETVDTALQLVTSLAATATAGTLGAGVTVVDEHGKRSRAASNAATEEADALQYRVRRGPCLTAWRAASWCGSTTPPPTAAGRGGTRRPARWACARC